MPFGHFAGCVHAPPQGYSLSEVPDTRKCPIYITTYFLFLVLLNIFIRIRVKYAYLKDTLCQARLKIHEHPLENFKYLPRVW